MNLLNGLFFTFTLGIVTTIACGGNIESTPAPSPVALALRAIAGSTDLAIGKNRFVFALLNESSAPVRSSGARVSFSYLLDNTRVSHTEVEATFRRWPMGPGGVFTAQVDFPEPGTWFAEIFPHDGEAEREVARLAFGVNQQSSTPSLGSLAPKSRSRIATDVADLEDITTDPEPDPELYSQTIAQALNTGLPLLVTFATPALCTSATCGPQVDVVKVLKETYKDRVNFIHVEIYDNPQQMRREGLQQARISPVIEEWGLPSEPWTFLVDAEGRVAAKFEAFTSVEELQEALLKTIGS